MCGRAFSTYSNEELEYWYFHQPNARKIPEFKSTYNLAPTQETLVLRVVEGERQLDLLHWGLIPPWEKEFKTKLSTINAKSETVFTSPLYKDSIRYRRCIIPLSGFFEWKRDGERKRPFCIRSKRGPTLSIAGIWSVWRSPAGDERYSFALLTTAANTFIAKIHDRMPVILAPEQEEAWLDPELTQPIEIARMLKPCPDALLEAYEISVMVNSPRNNREEILEPA